MAAPVSTSVPDEVLETLARRYDVPPGRFELLGGGEAWSDGVRYAMPGEPARVLKVQATAAADHGSRAARLERLSLGAMLAADGAPLPPVWPSSRAGRLMECVDHADATYVAYAVEWLPGRTLGSLPRAERTPLLATLGRVLGRMHTSSRRLPTWRASTSTIDDVPVLSWEGEWRHFADTCDDRAVGDVWAAIRHELASVPIERDGFGFVHNDPHLHNVLVDGDQVAIIDLDVATYHWFAADLATAVFATSGEGRHRDALARDQVAQLIDGYLATYPLAARWLDALPLFVEYRRALLLMAMGAELPPQVRATWHRSVVERRPSFDPSWPLPTG